MENRSQYLEHILKQLTKVDAIVEEGRRQLAATLKFIDSTMVLAGLDDPFWCDELIACDMLLVELRIMEGRASEVRAMVSEQLEGGGGRETPVNSRL